MKPHPLDIKTQWGRRIAEARRGRQLTQVQLAAETDLFPQTISRLERGEMGSINTYERVARVLDLDLAAKQ